MQNHKVNILYVDDDEMMLYLFKRMLGDDYHVETTTEVDHVESILKEKIIEIVVSDYNMPGTTGVELLQKILKNHPEVGRVLVTGTNEIHTIKEAINIAQVDYFILKPLDEESLRSGINRVVETLKLKSENLLLQDTLSKTIERQKELLTGQRKIIKLNNTLVKKLYHSENVKRGDWEDAIKEITEQLSLKMDISRVSVWYYNQKIDDGYCIDMFSKLKNKHRQGYSLDRTNYKGITDIIKNEWVIQVEDISNFTEARLPNREYLERHRITSVLYLPFYIGRDVYGVLACEQQEKLRYWSNDEVHFISSITDIVRLTYRTYERKLAEEQLNEAYKELKNTHSQLLLSEKMASLGQLTAGIAHEINNPINFVYAGVNALDKNLEYCLQFGKLYDTWMTSREDSVMKEIIDFRSKVNYDELQTDIKSLVGDIRNGAVRTAEIVKGLRNFSRLDEAERKMADIHEGIESTLILLRSKMSGRIEVIRNYDDSLPSIFCYPGQLNQVFMNILSNAVQAIKNEGSISITTTNYEDRIQIDFTDTGDGVPDHIKGKIFDPFFTTKDVGLGSGLGLSISFGIIVKHKGTLSVESVQGQGATFKISLPKN